MGVGYGSAMGWQAAGAGLHDIAKFLLGQQAEKKAKTDEQARQDQLRNAIAGTMAPDDPRRSLLNAPDLSGIASYLVRPLPESPDAQAKREYDNWVQQQQWLRDHPAPTPPRNIDPNSPEGIDAAVERERRLRAVRGDAEQAYNDAVGRAILALRKHNGDERMALAELATQLPNLPVGIRVRAIADAKAIATRQKTADVKAEGPFGDLLKPDTSATPTSPPPTNPPTSGPNPLQQMVEPVAGPSASAAPSATPVVPATGSAGIQDQQTSMADEWERLVAGGMSPEQATTQVLAKKFGLSTLPSGG